MDKLALAAVAGVVLCVFVVMKVRFERARRTALQHYWMRACCGRDWKRTFPQASMHQIRQYLMVLVSAFAFPQKRALQFQPTDCVYGIYRAIYPELGWPDALELETFAQQLERKYGIHLRAIWREDLTLGEVFARTLHVAT